MIFWHLVDLAGLQNINPPFNIQLFFTDAAAAAWHCFPAVSQGMTVHCIKCTGWAVNIEVAPYSRYSLCLFIRFKCTHM